MAQMRKLGSSGLEVAPLAIGGNVFGWTADEKSSFRLLDAFTDAGFNLIDTADVYSRWIPGNQGGESETIIGKWLKQSKKRDRVVLATKVGMEMAPDKKGLAASYIRQAAADSLRRLQVEQIDLYFAHQDDPDTPLEETLETFDALVREGKVKAIGASNYSGERLREALRISKENNLASYQCLQPHYSLIERSEFETTLEPVCREEGLGVVTYFSLASGFLAGKYRSEADLEGKARSGMVQKYLNERGFRILEALDEAAKQHDASPAQVAIAWLVSRPVVTAPIASATSVEQLDELLRGATLSLDSAALERLDAASAG